MPHFSRNKIYILATILVAAFGLTAALFLTAGNGSQTASGEDKDIGLVKKVIGSIEAHPLPPPTLLTYIEVIDGCGPAYDSTCVNVRGKPSTTTPAVAQLRKGMVLLTSGTVESEGRTWYKVTFKEWLRYPERHKGDWYVAGDFVRPIKEQGPQEFIHPSRFASAVIETVIHKRIVVDISEQLLYAYDGDTLFMQQAVSTGVKDTPTPIGTFTVFRKTPSRYMQGPIPGISTHEYDLPGVPWNMYFTSEGAVFHGAYWHNDFGHVHSNGCVNLPPEKAKELYQWGELGMQVTIRP